MGIPGVTGARLRLGSIWQHYSFGLYAVAGGASTYLLWRGMQSAAGLLVVLHGPALSDTALLGAAAALVAACALYARSVFTVSHTAVYRQAVRQLSTSPAVLEVLGSPVVASPVHVAASSGGGLRFKDLRVKARKPRVAMTFELTGPDRRGLVALEARKKQGRHVFSLLALDVLPSRSTLEGLAGAAGVAGSGSRLSGAARLYLAGDAHVYERSEPLLVSLRSPLMHAAGMQAVYERADEEEDELDRLVVPKTPDEPATPSSSDRDDAGASAAPVSVWSSGVHSLWQVLRGGGSKVEEGPTLKPLYPPPPKASSSS
ncbi:hypothetical protein FOA52_011687 [Chlamydomonas sp. UWO 241]|nr:hypothetical protein FOA52_011687 [Chlamydomonas sp. UWO 241]